jgi:MoxR-like ATPase
MEERQVTVDGVSYAVPRPFLVIATQNPIDLGGTYRLPEAQLDRFLMRIQVGYPDETAEADVLDERVRGGGEIRTVGPVVSVERAARMIRLAANVHVDPAVTRYVIRLAAASRDRPEVRLGLSTRGALSLVRAAQAHALAAGRAYVVPQDVKAIVKPVVGHRLILTAEAEVEGLATDALLDELLSSVPVPVRA